MKEGQDIIEAGPADDAFGRRNFGLFADISVRLSVEVGSTALKLSELMELAEGSVVELDRQADEPIDLYVNGTLFATGRLVVVDDTDWAVRIEHVFDKADINPESGMEVAGWPESW